MAKLLFGPPSVRINIEKAWRHLNKPELIHGSIEERKQFIYKVKNELDVEDFLRRSNRKMTHGPLRYWKYPVWVIEAKGSPIASSPRHFPLELPRITAKNEFHEEELSNFVNEDLQRELREVEKKYEKEPFMNIKKSMKRLQKELRKSAKNAMDEINKEAGIEKPESDQGFSDKEEDFSEDDYMNLNKFGHLLKDFKKIVEANGAENLENENEEDYVKKSLENENGELVFPEMKFQKFSQNILGENSDRDSLSDDKDYKFDNNGKIVLQSGEKLVTEVGDDEEESLEEQVYQEGEESEDSGESGSESEAEYSRRNFKAKPKLSESEIQENLKLKKFLNKLRNIKREKELLRQEKDLNDAEFVGDHLDFVQESDPDDTSDYIDSEIENFGADISKNDESENEVVENQEETGDREQIEHETQENFNEESTDLEFKPKNRHGKN